jgi:hypothetical protein
MTVLELLREHGVPTVDRHRHVTTGWQGVECPLCSPNSGKFKLGYRPGSRYFTCWTCGYQKLYDTLSLITGLTYKELRSKLTGLDDPTPAHVKARGFLKPPGPLQTLSGVHRRYLASRGLDAANAVLRYGIQGLGLAGKFSWRLYIPVVLDGRVVSWTTRAISDDCAVRYVSASPDREEVSHKTLLFGEDFCRDTVIVCEGPMDAMRIGPGSVATFGVNVSPDQVERISRYPARVVLFDSEVKAQRAAKRLVRNLSGFPGTTVRVCMESSKDPGGASEEEIRDLRNKFLEER